MPVRSVPSPAAAEQIDAARFAAEEADRAREVHATIAEARTGT